MDTPRYTPVSLTISVDWVHIREAECRGANGNRAVTPFTLALVEQTRYSSGRVTEEAVIFIDFEGEPTRFAACQPFRDYLEAWKRGDGLLPARFTLERGG